VKRPRPSSVGGLRRPGRSPGRARAGGTWTQRSRARQEPGPLPQPLRASEPRPGPPSVAAAARAVASGSTLLSGLTGRTSPAGGRWRGQPPLHGTLLHDPAKQSASARHLCRTFLSGPFLRRQSPRRICFRFLRVLRDEPLCTEVVQRTQTVGGRMVSGGGRPEIQQSTPQPDRALDSHHCQGDRLGRRPF